MSIHQKNLQILATEMFKVSNGLSLVLTNDIFKLTGEQTYNLRKLSQFYRPKSGHQRNVLVGFVKIKLEMSILFKKRSR